MENKFAIQLQNAPARLEMGELAQKKRISRTIPMVSYTWGRFDVVNMSVTIDHVDLVPYGYTAKEKTAKAEYSGLFVINETITESMYSLSAAGFVQSGDYIKPLESDGGDE